MVLAWLRRVFALPALPEPIYVCPKCGFGVWAGGPAPTPIRRYCGPDQKQPRCDKGGEHFDFYHTCLRCGFQDQWRRPVLERKEDRP
jgi:hypothetical protein